MRDQETGGASGELEGELAIDVAESRLEALADEMSSLISACPADDREALHDYAVSLVRERMPLAEAIHFDRAGDDEQAEVAKTRKRRTSSAATSFGYGALLLMVGPLLLLVFPPVGMMLVVAGLGLMGWGGIATVFARLRSKSRSRR